MLLATAGADDTTGRFLIASGQIETSKGVQHVILKIDTMSGETWQLSTLALQREGKAGGDTWGWVPLDSDGMAAGRKLQGSSDAGTGPQIAPTTLRAAPAAAPLEIPGVKSAATPKPKVQPPAPVASTPRSRAKQDR
ncbi:MAG: hypothetical protein QOE70_1900 [Chthoniobacter sp.]|jgi:hypothetical protein|nr:hypothetical protein [Chthoniobacter sp.]